MSSAINRYLAYVNHSYDEICNVNQYQLVPWIYHWTRLLHDRNFPCRCGKTGHQYPACPEVSQSMQRFITNVLASIKTKWNTYEHNKKFQTCFNCYLMTPDKVQVQSTESLVTHTKYKQSVQGICDRTPPHIIGPVVEMFRHDLYRELVGYPYEKVTVDGVVGFLLEPVLIKGKTIEISRLQFLLATDIFATINPFPFPTHRFDKTFTESILRGDSPSPSVMKYAAQITLNSKIECTLAEVKTLGPSQDSQGPALGEDEPTQPQIRTSNSSSKRIPPPPSQDPGFSFRQSPPVDDGEEDFFPQSPMPTQNGRQQFLDPFLPPSQNPGFSFGKTPPRKSQSVAAGPTRRKSHQSVANDISPLSKYTPRISIPNLSGSSRNQLSRSTPGPSRPCQSAREDLSRSTPGPSRSRDGDSTSSSRPTPRDALSTTPSDSTPRPFTTRNNLSLNTGQTRHTQEQYQPPLGSTSGTRSQSIFLTPGVPASQTPITPTPNPRRKATSTALSMNSPLGDTPIIPASVLRFNPYPRPLHPNTLPPNDEHPTQ